MNLQVEIEQEADKRWLAEIRALPGGMAYGQSAQEAIARAKALALRVVVGGFDNPPRAFTHW